MRLPEVTAKLTAVGQAGNSYEAVFLVDPTTKTLKRLPAIPLK